MSATTVTHRPAPLRVGASCRVDCTCGWRGPTVPLYGDGQQPWIEHFNASKGET